MKGLLMHFVDFFKIANFGNCCNTLSDENKHCPNMSQSLFFGPFLKITFGC